MGVKNRWLVLPVILAILLIIGAYWAVSFFKMEDAGSTYSYKEKLFIEDEVGLVEIEIDPDDWADMLDNPMGEEYKEANITINGEKVSNVAVRTKGNSSLSSVANSDSERYSLKVDFNYYESTQSFYGLKKLNLNNNFSDSTQMREFVSYELMEQIGLPTPSHSYLKVMINGEYYGLMLGVEQVDDIFIAQNFKTNAGYLFKPDGVGSDLVYTTDDLDDYSGIAIKGENSMENSSIIQMMKEISQGDTSSLDTDMILRYFSMNTALVSLDSYQGQMKHNYYLYENKEGIFSILPWDYNMSFGGFGVGMGGMPGNLSNSQTENSENLNEDTGAQKEQADKNSQDTEQGTPPDMSNMPNMGQGTPPDMSNMPNMGQGIPPDMSNMPNMGQGTPPDMSNMPNSEQGTSTDLNSVSKDNQSNASPNRGMPFGNQQGGMPGMSDELISEESINFSIYEPVSGASLEERPLLNVLLKEEELLAKYEEYMKQIATELLTEENVSAITSKLEKLLVDYVEEDPSKFYTTEEFIEGVSGDNSLPEFAKQRSESILKQLSGELVVESSTTNSMAPAGGNFPQMNRGGQDNDGQRMRGNNRNFTEMTDQDFTSFLESMKDNNFFELPDDFESMSMKEQKEFVQAQMDNQMQGAPMGMRGGEQRGQDSSQGYSKETIYVTGAILLLALLAILVVRRIGR